MIPGSANPLLLKSAAAAGGYQVSRSLRFNSSDSGFCSRTPAVAGSRTTWTWAAWVKRTVKNTATDQMLFTGGTTNSDTGFLALDFNSSDKLRLSSAATNFLITTAVYRDPGAWMHIVLAFDATQGTNANKVKLYVNSTEVTVFDTDGRSSISNQDYGVNQAAAHEIGRASLGSNKYLDGYLADIHFIDGQALTPSSFTEVSATTGQLIPKAYTGTFGTNGFWLKFSDNSAATAATLGKDYSGNSNNWTPNNLSVTAGAGNDSLVDTPTSYGTDTGVGGEVRGNYATLNPLLPTLTPTNGNLDTPNSAGQNYSTIAVSTGKWYVESTVGPITAGTACGLGLHFNPTADTSAGFYTSGAYVALLYENVLARYEGAVPNVNFYPTAGAGSILAIKIDLDSGTQTISYYVNNVLITSSNLPAGKTWFVTTRQNNNQSLNFGQRAFAYTAPSGFKALCDTNLPAPLVAKPNTLMDVKLYTGNGSTQTISGLNFSPDFVWIKDRANGLRAHRLCDTVRGATKEIYSNETDAEATDANGLTAFTSDGFSVGSSGGVNGSSNGIVAWAWDAGTSTVSNGSGSITSQVRANASAGFSVVTYTGNGTSGATVGHGLGVAPQLLIVKRRSSAGSTANWAVWHGNLTAGYNMWLNGTDNAQAYSPSRFTSTLPTSTVFSLGGGDETNYNTGTFVAYCFAPVVGYSSFGSYTGNGSTDGPFVYTGFRPRWLLVKASSAGESYPSWRLFDTARDTYNVAGLEIYPNLSLGESDSRSGTPVDILSNGFKLRANATWNTSGVTYIYMTFAENPFQYARAR